MSLLAIAIPSAQRSTGLSPALSRIAGKDLRQLMVSYLEMGEYAFDFAVRASRELSQCVLAETLASSSQVVVMGRSNAFERKR